MKAWRFAILLMIISVLGFVSCQLPGGGVSTVGDVPEDAQLVEDYDDSEEIPDFYYLESGSGASMGVTLYFGEEDLVKYSLVDGVLDASFPTEEEDSGEEATSGKKISVDEFEAIVGRYWLAGEDVTDVNKSHRFVIYIEDNQEYLETFEEVSSLTRPGRKISMFRVRVLELPDHSRTMYVRPPTGSTVSYLVGNDLAALPTTALPESKTIPISSGKYVIFSYRAPGVSATDPTRVEYGYYQIGSTLPVPQMRGPDSTSIAHGSNISLPIGSVIRGLVNSSYFDRIYYYVSTTGLNTQTPPNTSTPNSGYSTTVSGDNISIDVTYTGGLVYLYFWGRDKNNPNNFSDFVQVTITQSGGTGGGGTTGGGGGGGGGTTAQKANVSVSYSLAGSYKLNVYKVPINAANTVSYGDAQCVYWETTLSQLELEKGFDYFVMAYGNHPDIQGTIYLGDPIYQNFKLNLGGTVVTDFFQDFQGRRMGRFTGLRQ